MTLTTLCRNEHGVYHLGAWDMKSSLLCVAALAVLVCPALGQEAGAGAAASSATIIAELQGPWNLRFFKYDRGLMNAVRQFMAASSAPASGYRAAARLHELRIPEPASVRLLSATGGEVLRADRAGARIPPPALAQNLAITVSHPGAADEAARKAKAADKGLRHASLPVAFGPDGAVFGVPVTVTLPYDASLARSQGIREADLKVHYWNPILQVWEALPSRMDAVEHLVSAEVRHFSIYQVLGTSGGIGVAAAEVALGFKAAYAFPNPVRGQNTVTIRVQPGLADSVEVRVYDLAGRKIHASSSFNNLGASDDGNGLGAQFTYDHFWDVSGVGSGVYNYIVTAKKAGQTDIVKSGKVAVVK